MTTTLDLAGFRLEAWQFGAWALLALAATAMVRRLLGRWDASTGVRMAAFSAVMSTLVSGNSSWRFFGTHLQVTDPHVRALMFATGECMQFALALMARENYMAENSTGGGIPSLLVWVVSGVQCVPAFEEGGLAGGFVRAYLGPISAAILWHLAMGVELVHLGPADHRGGRLGRISRFLAESTMASLGLTQPDRDAQEIAKDRAVKRAVRHGLRYDLMTPKTRTRRRGRRAIRRMKWAMLRAEIGTDRPRTHRLALQLLGARSALALIELELPSLWDAVRDELLEAGWIAPPRERRRCDEDAGGHTDVGGDAGDVSAAAEIPRRRGSGAETTVSVLLQGLGFADQAPDSRTVPGYGLDTADMPAGYAESAYPAAPGYGFPAAETFVSVPGAWPAGLTGAATVTASAFGAGYNLAPGQRPAMPGRVHANGHGVREGDALGYGADTRFEAYAAEPSAGIAGTPLSPIPASPQAPENGADTAAETGPETPETNISAAETVVSGSGTGASAAETDDSATQDLPPWTETRWSRATETIAREVVADFHARHTNITCRAWVAAVRERRGQVSSEHVAALYGVARAPEVPDPADTAN
ncbi:hypothetical protein KDK95_27930 [Actinospica sp. MGRD01-02]|uniref:Uncharacterized protein n=1 Tax=Actinospica acidithermotolerans TaxID=2828514 RepID=A0A941ECD4_9ACTN|nr:hypothetical protein [Actinospica acidithermotolerans]MBR7830165.1 hypothetical protein [Actinospica acidithermotolerans]